MTQEELEYNKRCAIFLGWKETTEQFKIDWVGCKTKERLERLDNQYIPILEKNGDVLFSDFSVMDFTNDWNCIMDVKDKICQLNLVDEFNTKYDSVIKSYFCSILPSYKDSFESFYTNIFPTEKEAVVSVINIFLIWYEINK